MAVSLSLSFLFPLQFMCWGDRVFPPLEPTPACTFLTPLGVTAPAPVTWAVSPVNWRVGGGCPSTRKCAATLSPCDVLATDNHPSQNGGDKILSFLPCSLAGILPPKDVCAWQLLVTGVWSRRGQTCRKQACFLSLYLLVFKIMSWYSGILQWFPPVSVWTQESGHLWSVSICCPYKLCWCLNCPIFGLRKPLKLGPQVLLHDPALTASLLSALRGSTIPAKPWNRLFPQGVGVRSVALEEGPAWLLGEPCFWGFH